MKKLNNKGFAISTVIYGLSIMGILLMSILMGIMSTSRTNNSNLSKTIEDELNRFSRTSTSFTKNAGTTAQEYVVPTGESGWYRIELWGAAGAANKGKGAYTSGVIYLEEGEVLYFYVGDYGQATDVRLVSGPYTGNNEDAKISYETRIMVAAAGGVNDGADGGTLVGYNNNMVSLGGRIRTKDATGTQADYKLEDGVLAGYPTTYANSGFSQASGTPKPSNSAGGGDGYIGSSDSNIGGISFISGYAGSIAYVKNTNTNNPKYTYHENVDDGYGNASYEISGKPYYFYDGNMLPGVNPKEGHAQIERVVKATDEVTHLPRKNAKMNKVTQIRDCLESTNSNIAWSKIQAIYEGDNVAQPLAVHAANSDRAGFTCSVATLNGEYNLDEIAVWHKDGVDYKNHTVEVYHGGTGNWEYIKAPGIGTNLSETENVNGIHISAYQPDYTVDLPDTGNYYIVPVLTENKVITAHELGESDNDPIKVEPLNGYQRQTWSVELIDQNLRIEGKREYKAIELARFKSLSIYLDENKIGNQVRANTTFNAYSRNETEIWNFIPVGNGTYRIATAMPVFDTANPSGNLCPQSNPNTAENLHKILIGRENVDTQRFKLIAVDY